MPAGATPPEPRPAGTGGAGAAADAVAAVVAAERVGIVAGLIRRTGDWELAEDCVQDAVARALDRWPVDGLPDSPAGWLTRVARNRAIDVLRRRRTEQAALRQRALLDEPPTYPDDRLALIFTCCHPALPLDGRVALTLKTVAGLSTGEIARAFLVPEPTMSQRLLRTKRKIAHAGIPYRVPPPDLLADRTAGVLAVLYLIFNEGYGRAGGRLATEALRLAGTLVSLMPREHEVRGLYALLLFQSSRRDARFDPAGDLVPMEEQDRSRWDRAMIAAGRRQLRLAGAGGAAYGPYRLQASIAACHAAAATPADTDWRTIVVCYDALLAIHPSPVVALNRAIAVGFADGFDAGLAALDEVDATALAGYHLLPAARADLLRRLGRYGEAAGQYRAALELVPSGGPEYRLLHRRLAELGEPG